MANNLITEWREQVTTNGSLASAVREMNTEINKCHTTSRFNEWQSGKVVPSLDVIKYMLPTVLPKIIAQYELSEDDAERLANDIINLLP